jgi:hypothetical protein
MMNIVTTIIPIFVIIILGWLARVYGFIRADFIFDTNLNTGSMRDPRKTKLPVVSGWLSVVE